MVVIDTDVFVLAFAFHRDGRQAANSQFLEVVRSHEPTVTIYSVMELLGQLSFNLSAERLAQWPVWLQDNFGLSVIYPVTAHLTADDFFRAELVERPLQRMALHSSPYLDSVILELTETTGNVRAFVTWNARHYQGRTSLRVVTPGEFVDSLPA